MMLTFGQKLVLIVALTACPGGQEAGSEPPPGRSENSETRRAITSKEIAGLIEQLGSKEFTQREAASRMLDAISYPALESLRKAADQDKDAEVRHRSAALIERIENHLDALTAEYGAFGLPPPPASAKLAAYPFADIIERNGKREIATYGLVFLVAQSKSQRLTILQGTDRFEVGPFADLAVIEPEAAFSREVGKPSPADEHYRLIERLLREGRICFFNNGFPSPTASWRIANWPSGRIPFLDDGLAFAIQCKARGWDRLGQTVFPHYQEIHASPREDLIEMAWSHWRPKLLEQGTDWKLIAGQLRAICATDKSIYEPEHRALLRSLEAALVPTNAKPGSIAAMIDDLIECHTTGLPFGEGDADPRAAELVYRWPGVPDGPDPRFLRLVVQGFDAVPELIEHLDDNRLTRTYLKGQLKVPVGFQYSVKDVVSDLLNGLADDELGRDWLDRYKGYTVDKARAQVWWEKVKRAGEENYAVRHVLSEGQRERLPAWELQERRAFEPEGTEWPNSQLLWIIFEKYPQRLPEIYRTALDKTQKIASWSLAYAIRRSKLPRDKRLELLLYGCKHKDLRHRAAALWQLKELDREEFLKNLIDTLEGLPPASVEPPWECPESLFAVIAREADDPRAWQALLRTAKRADVGLRLEYLGRLETINDTPPQRWQRAKFLAEFLDDESVREGKGRLYEAGANAEVESYEIEVRNFAAIAIGRQLRLPHPYPRDLEVFYPSRYLSEEWSALREKVRKALQKR